MSAHDRPWDPLVYSYTGSSEEPLAEFQTEKLFFEPPIIAENVPKAIEFLEYSSLLVTAEPKVGEQLLALSMRIRGAKSREVAVSLLAEHNVLVVA